VLQRGNSAANAPVLAELMGGVRRVEPDEGAGAKLAHGSRTRPIAPAGALVRLERRQGPPRCGCACNAGPIALRAAFVSAAAAARSSVPAVATQGNGSRTRLRGPMASYGRRPIATHALALRFPNDKARASVCRQAWESSCVTAHTGSPTGTLRAFALASAECQSKCELLPERTKLAAQVAAPRRTRLSTGSREATAGPSSTADAGTGDLWRGTRTGGPIDLRSGCSR